MCFICRVFLRCRQRSIFILAVVIEFIELWTFIDVPSSPPSVIKHKARTHVQP